MKKGRLRSFLVRAGLVIAGLVVILGVIYLVLPKGPRETMPFDDPHLHGRTPVSSEQFMAATGTP